MPAMLPDGHYWSVPDSESRCWPEPGYPNCAAAGNNVHWDRKFPNHDRTWYWFPPDSYVRQYLQKLFYKRIIPDFIEQAGTIAGRIIVHLVRMPHYIETAQLQHTPQPSIIQTHHPLQVTSELLIHNPLEGSGGNIHIHNLRFIIIQHVYGTDAVVQRKFPETVNGRITLFIQIIYFQTKIKFYLPSIFLFIRWNSAR